MNTSSNWRFLFGRNAVAAELAFLKSVRYDAKVRAEISRYGPTWLHFHHHGMRINQHEKPIKHGVPQEWKLVAIRECPMPEDMMRCNNPDHAAEYWRRHVTTNPVFNAECESFVVLLLDVHHRVKGHHIVSMGTISASLVHAREVFRFAIIAGASAVLLMHNHPSGETRPSKADIEVTEHLAKAGRLIGIDVLDHVIVAGPRHYSIGVNNDVEYKAKSNLD